MKDPAFLFKSDEWFTPNTYNRNFKCPPKKSGVYLLVKPIFDLNKANFQILYVGSTSCLEKRYKNHEVLRKLQIEHDYIQFYFKETENYIDLEKGLIKKIQPKYNKQWR